MKCGARVSLCRRAVAGLICWLGFAGLFQVQAAQDHVCLIFPVPREYAVKGAAPVALSPDAVIVIGDQATAPEKYAAGLLQRLVERRYKLKLASKTEAEAGAPAQAILVGTRAGNKMLDAECAKRKVEIGADTPVADAFAMDTTGGAVLIAGSNPRGAIYAADAFASLLTLKDGKPVFPAVTVRDWPTIAWRGRPGINSASDDKLEDPDYFDPVLQNRVNFIDLREGDFGFRPGKPMTADAQARYAKHVEKAHSAGLFVYGVVSCGETDVEPSLAKFKELIELKVDGLWISFDDAGNNAKDPDKLIAAVLALGREHGITGRAIATTPPQKNTINGKEYRSYRTIDTPVNRERAKFPGFETAKWFFTRMPCEADLKMAQEIGLKGPPAWWHNWPRPNAGFTYTARQFINLQKDKKTHLYAYYPGLDEMNRWDYASPCSQAELAKLESWKYTDAAWIWGGGAQEYIDATLMLWAWNPEAYELEKARRAAYARVFGPGQVEAAAKYDDGLKRLLNEIFEVNYYRTFDGAVRDKLPMIPYRLAMGQTKEKALETLNGMQEALKTLKAKAAAESGIRADRLESWYLAPMQVTIRVARGVLEIDFPGRNWTETITQLDELVKAGKKDEVRALVQQVRKEYTPEHLKSVSETLKDLDFGYYSAWGVEGMKQLEMKLIAATDWPVSIREKLDARDKLFEKARAEAQGGKIRITFKPELVAGSPSIRILRAPITDAATEYEFQYPCPGPYLDYMKAPQGKAVYEGDPSKLSAADGTLLFEDAKVVTGCGYLYWVTTVEGHCLAGPLPVMAREPSAWLTYDQMVARLDAMVKAYPGLVQMDSYGTTVDGKPLKGLVIGKGGRTVALVGVVHAGESGPELIIPAVERLLKEHPEVFEKARLAILPMANADMRDRLARGWPWYVRTNRNGVDLNRNFDASWEIVDKSYNMSTDDPKANTYRGTKASSEPETRALAAFVEKTAPDMVFAYHYLTSVTGGRMFVAKMVDDTGYMDRSRACAETYLGGMYPCKLEGAQGRVIKRPESAGIGKASSQGTFAAWLYKQGIPGLELESDKTFELEQSKTRDTTAANMAMNQQLHYGGILAVLRAAPFLPAAAKPAANVEGKKP